MILKKFKRTNLSRTKRSMIGELVDYVLAEKDSDGKQKCAWHFSENFIAATKNGQRAEMIALAEESIKSKMPCAHWMIGRTNTSNMSIFSIISYIYIARYLTPEMTGKTTVFRQLLIRFLIHFLPIFQNFP